ncbi:hypothetical protein L0Z13_11580 [Burkholderia multivorans]|uniref:hypothetical protein n=1 Tax=Burkholderia multivorans TaxID=87883 RepID=UPI002018FF8F|nr:hypothetical protein [Burkholderia multivorans]UQO04984.1 hypothetical protein L0Z13_11580 [Burkholderia multivorans]
MQQMADGPAKRFYTLQLNDLRTSLAGQAITWQAEQHRSYNVSQYQQGNDAAARAIAMDPNLYGATRASQLALIRRGADRSADEGQARRELQGRRVDGGWHAHGFERSSRSARRHDAEA